MPLTEKVIFRVDKARGTAFALFPEIPGNPSGTTCRAYCWEGAQFSAHVPEKMKASREATPDEAKDLATILVKFGYKLRTVKRETRVMREVRRISAEM
jgi:hypothetical protein